MARVYGALRTLWGERARSGGRPGRSQGQWRHTKNEFLHLPWTPTVIFCRFLMVDLVHFGGLQRSLGGLGGPSLELLGAYVWPMGALGGVLGEVCMWRVQRVCLDTEFGDPKGTCTMARYTIIVILLWYFDSLQKVCGFETEGSSGADDIQSYIENSVVVRLGGP